MALPPIGKINLDYGQNKLLELVQRSIVAPLQALLGIPFNDGVLLEGVAIATTDTNVAHKLGRVARGFIVTKINGDAVIYQSATAPSDATRFLVLKAGAAVTCDLWCF